MNIVRRAITVLAICYAFVGAWSAYRAWVQVRSVEVRVISETLRAGAPVTVHVVTSGRVPVVTRLELVQGDCAELIADLRVAGSADGFHDPRFREGTMTPTVSAQLLSHFQSGPAVLRATGLGRPQWMRTPPPTITEIPVRIAPF